MYDLSFASSTAAPSGQVTLWVEACDGSRVKLCDALNRVAGKEQMKAYVEHWVNSGTDRKIERADDLSWLLLVKVKRDPRKAKILGQIFTEEEKPKYEATGIVYVEPLPLRPSHPGDVRIDRRLHPRYPRAA